MSFFSSLSDWFGNVLAGDPPQPALPLPPHLVLGDDVTTGREIVLTGWDFEQSDEGLAVR